MPELGDKLDATIPQNSHPAVTITVVDRTAKGFTKKPLGDLVWSLRYQALYHYNRSPWVERDYCAPIADVKLIGHSEKPPPGSWHVELLDTSTEPGALGWHEDEAHASSAHSARGLASGTETPLSKVFCKTSREDGVEPSEVASHEIMEMIVDPWVMNESELRIYTNPADGKEYIGEVGDPVQGRGYDVGAPEKHPCNVAEAVVADFAYPGWWGQPQTRKFTAAAEEFGLAPRVEPFALAPGGYMSVRLPGGSWEQIYGADKKRAEARAHAFERPGQIG